GQATSGFPAPRRSREWVRWTSRGRRAVRVVLASRLLCGLARRRVLIRRNAAALPGRHGADLDRVRILRRDAELRSHFVERPLRVREPVDREKVDAVVRGGGHGTATGRIGEADGHPFMREMPAVVLEAPQAGRAVTSFE